MNTINKIKPKRKLGVFKMKLKGHKTPKKRNVSSFDIVRMLHSKIRDIDLVIKNHPNMGGLNILKQDMLDRLNFKENNRFLNDNK